MELVKKIKGLKSIKPRAEFKDFGRDILLSQIRRIEKAQPAVENRPVFNWHFYFRAYRDIIMHKAMQPAFGLLMLLVLVLGSSLTVNAAFYSLPGNKLYPIKIILEKTQLALVRNDVSRAELKIEFAKKRVEELDKIVAHADEPEVKAEKIDFIVKKIKKEVASVKSHVQNLDQDRSPVFRIALSIDSAASDLAEALNKSAKDLSDDSKIIVEEAADSAEDASISALETLVGVATSTVNVEIGENDISDSLSKKINIIKDETAQNENIRAEDLIVIDGLIKESELDIERGNFEAALGKITEIKSLIKEAGGAKEEMNIEGGLPAVKNTEEEATIAKEAEIELQEAAEEGGDSTETTVIEK